MNYEPPTPEEADDDLRAELEQYEPQPECRCSGPDSCPKCDPEGWRR